MLSVNSSTPWKFVEEPVMTHRGDAPAHILSLLGGGCERPRSPPNAFAMVHHLRQRQLLALQSAAAAAAAVARLAESRHEPNQDDWSDSHVITKKKRKPKPSDMTCSVCGDKAPDHIHYGGIACFSCRAFFRRSVPKHQAYFCSGDRNCEISVATRKNCQFCRYQKCLHSGMKPSWVLSDDEKLERMAKQRAKASSSSNSEGPSSKPSSPSAQDSGGEEQYSRLISQPFMCFTMEEEKRVDELLYAQESTRHTIPIPKAVMSELIDMTHTRRPMSHTGVVELYRVVYSRVAKFATFVDDFESLGSAEDKKALLSKNLDSMANIRVITCFHPYGHGNLTQQLQQFGKGYEDLETPGPNAIEIRQVFRQPWAISPEHEDLFFETMRKISLVNCDVKASLLFQLVALFSVLELNLESRRAAESAQERMALMLQRYLKMRYGHLEANTLFPKYVLLLQDLRRLSNILTEEKTKL